MTDISLENYYYGKQIKRYIIEYMAIFGGLKVAIGKNDFNSQSNKIIVPITYGSKDRVVAAILSENTQNKPIRVPTLSANMMGIELDDSLRVGVGQTVSNVHLPLGATLPDGLKVIEKYKPIPYRLVMETTIYASNTDQHLQMLEQIMMLFDPILQIQTSDDFQDWSKITTVTLDQIGLEEEYPSGTSRRIITTTFQFSFPIYLSPPINLRYNYIKEIKMRIVAATNTQTVDEIINSDTEEYETIINVDDTDIPSK